MAEFLLKGRADNSIVWFWCILSDLLQMRWQLIVLQSENYLQTPEMISISYFTEKKS